MACRVLLLWLLVTPVQFGFGRRFYRRAARALKVRVRVRVRVRDRAYPYLNPNPNHNPNQARLGHHGG